MKKRLILPLVISNVLLLQQAIAAVDAPYYVGLQYSQIEVDRDSTLTPDADGNTGGIIGGFNYNQYLAFEVRYNMGVSVYESTYADGGLYEEDIEEQIFLLTKFSYPITDTFNLFALAGYSDTAYEINARVSIDNGDGTSTNAPTTLNYAAQGFTYGIGAKYQFDKNVSVQLDYQVLPDFDTGVRTFELDGFNLGLTYNF